MVQVSLDSFPVTSRDCRAGSRNPFVVQVSLDESEADYVVLQFTGRNPFVVQVSLDTSGFQRVLKHIEVVIPSWFRSVWTVTYGPRLQLPINGS